MTSSERARGSQLLWETNANLQSSDPPPRFISTWQELKSPEQADDDIFHATETQLPAPRFLNLKEDPIMEPSSDYLNYRDAELDHIEEQIVQEVETIHMRDDRVDSGYEDVGADDSGLQSAGFHDSGLCSSLNDSRSDDFENTSSVHTYDFINEPIADSRYEREEKLVRRKSCPEPGHVHSSGLSLPKHHTIEHHEIESKKTLRSHSPSDSDANKAATGPSLQEITAMTRKISRPLLRKDDAQDMDDDQFDTFNWSTASELSSSRNITNVQAEPKPEVDKYTEITAQVRKATKPKVKELDIQPVRQRSVSHVQSPTVPALSPDRDRFSLNRSLSTVQSPTFGALSPDRERFSLTRSSSSNSSSSLSEFFPVQISAVDPCFRCGKQVYSLDKIGPIRKVLFHKQCFRCYVCNSVLNLKNYCQNSSDKTDKQVYCKNHEPAPPKAHVGLDDRNINITMNYPKLDRVNSNIRGSEEERAKGLNLRPLNIRGAATTPKLDIVCGGTYGFSYTGGSNIQHDAGLKSPLPSMRSPREMSLEEVEPRKVWTRSAINAATLDLTPPSAGRTAHHFYSYGSRAFSQM
ncbi:hypothetical protein FSP39_013981 [Pinctada imbricata]|uniref:LIM zinc-binding domain-containing protein n=1 Tax=Pinctada imbricata TaxID=66713 RepID=A0AA89C1R1_PINIB|nr:hypothetical protein FSP39_013981 [Pinctada imbricata]